MFKKRGSTTTLAAIICLACAGLGIWYGMSSLTERSTTARLSPEQHQRSNVPASAVSVTTDPTSTVHGNTAIGVATFTDTDTPTTTVTKSSQAVKRMLKRETLGHDSGHAGNGTFASGMMDMSSPDVVSRGKGSESAAITSTAPGGSVVGSKAISPP
ncbi:MAG TPA: hypothetical protein V6C76_17970 [Drouetiella sp.]